MQRCLKYFLLSCITLCHAVVAPRMAIAQVEADLHNIAITAIAATGEQYAQYDPRPDYSPPEISVDVEPPLIEHELVKQAEADIRQTFVASVVDDEELAQVDLFYRFGGETSFSRYQMMRVSYSSTYIAQIPTNPNELAPMEYYIQASDASGNRTVRGYTFSPLVRQIIAPANHVEATAQDESDPGTKAPNSTASKLPKAVYIVGGVLLLGLIASAGGSSGSSPSGGEECGTAGCRLTITVNPPLE